jgi:hypothetical protein
VADGPVSCCTCETTGPSEDDQVQQAILSLMVGIYPAQLSMEELVREMTDQPHDFAGRDRIEIAVRALTGAGLLHAHGQFLFATRAAVRADELNA